MHAAIFKTFVKTGEAQPQELAVEYLPDADVVIFSLAGKEIFTINYNDDLETIVAAIDSITVAKFDDDDDYDDEDDDY